MRTPGDGMTRPLSVSLACVLAWLGSQRLDAGFDVSAPRPVGKGTATVIRSTDEPRDRLEDGPEDLLIHFHGAVDTIRKAVERSGSRATVVVVNQPGLSAAYAAPFREDPELFASLLTEPRAPQTARGDGPSRRRRRVTLSCFSAGYGAVREILKDPDSLAHVDVIVAADSIYAGLEDAAAAPSVRQVDSRDMAGFLAFATAATRGEKVFVVTHSAQPTPYASTTETADYLLRGVGLARNPVAPAAGEEFPQVSQAGCGGFVVMGFAGASAPAHLFHLRAVDRWWGVAERLATDAADASP